jgi:acylglycerol lipase
MGNRQSFFSADLPHFANADGNRLYIKRWNPEADPRAVVFVCHGYGEHIERYNPLGSILAEKGFVVVGHDHVGHGKSEGIRADIEDFHFYVRDALQHIRMVKDEYPDIPFFLFGHSMGGSVATLTALESQDLFSGVLLSAPMIMIDPAQATPFKIRLVQAVATLFPQLHIGQLNTNDLSRDPRQVKAYEDDPLVYHGGIKARWSVVSLLRTADEIKGRLGEIMWPYLLMHGSEDKLILDKGSKKFHEESKSEDKTLKVYIYIRICRNSQNWFYVYAY